MTRARTVALPVLSTGVPGLDAILGGGFPELSFNLIAGAPGAGKTTLAHQFLFHNATVERPAIAFTVLGEPTIKLLRYQQQYEFFDPDAIGTRIHLVNLADAVRTLDLEHVLRTMIEHVERIQPGFVVVDSFRTVTRLEHSSADLGFERFVQRLSVHLTTWEVTSFLLGEYRQAEVQDPVFTVADGVLFMSQEVERNTVLRKLQVIKMRGMDTMQGLHAYRITSAGVQAFPRVHAIPRVTPPLRRHRLSTGLAVLDEMTGGGIPSGDVVAIAGPTGSGKTTIAAHFMQAAVAAREPFVLVVFEEFPRTYIERARRFVDLDALAAQGQAEVLYLRPLDLSVDEALTDVQAAIERIGAKRVVIDSLTGFELCLAPGYQANFGESMYRLLGALIAAGVTVLFTVESTDPNPNVRFTNDIVSFITDDIVLLRYVELEGKVLPILGVWKMRGSPHSRDLRLVTFAESGIEIGGTPRGLTELTTGLPKPGPGA